MERTGIVLQNSKSGNEQIPLKKGTKSLTAPSKFTLANSAPTAALKSSINRNLVDHGEHFEHLEIFGVPEKTQRKLLVDPAVRAFVTTRLLLSCIYAVDVLQTVAGSVAKTASNQKAKGKKGANAPHKADYAFKEFMGCLSRIYRDVWGLEPGESRPSGGGTADGPFIRFVSHVAKPLGIEKSGEAIAGYMRSRKGLRKLRENNF